MRIETFCFGVHWSTIAQLMALTFKAPALGRRKQGKVLGTADDGVDVLIWICTTLVIQSPHADYLNLTYHCVCLSCFGCRQSTGSLRPGVCLSSTDCEFPGRHSDRHALTQSFTAPAHFARYVDPQSLILGLIVCTSIHVEVCGAVQVAIL
jgi:hypothetical protein